MDSGFNVDNVLGPTEGRVGILYLSGEGELVLVDEKTGAEARQEVRRLGRAPRCCHSRQPPTPASAPACLPCLAASDGPGVELGMLQARRPIVP